MNSTRFTTILPLVFLLPFGCAAGRDAPPPAGDNDSAADAGTDGGPAVTGSVTGTVDGTSLAYGSAAFLTVSGSSATVVIASEPDVCHDNTGDAPGLVSLQLLLYSTGTTGPGTYPLGNNTGIRSGGALFFTQTESCVPVATAGSITLTTVGLTPGTTTSGTFDLTFPTGHLTGSFSAPFCVPDELTDGGTTGPSLPQCE